MIDSLEELWGDLCGDTFLDLGHNVGDHAVHNPVPDDVGDARGDPINCCIVWHARGGGRLIDVAIQTLKRLAKAFGMSSEQLHLFVKREVLRIVRH